MPQKMPRYSHIKILFGKRQETFPTLKGKDSLLCVFSVLTEFTHSLGGVHLKTKNVSALGQV